MHIFSTVELAEAAEFEIYEKYAEDILSSETRDALQDLVNGQDASKLSSAGHGFREAVKYYLPKLLLGPIWHAFSYFEYVRLLMSLSPSAEDKEVFEQVQGLINPLEARLKEHVSSLPRCVELLIFPLFPGCLSSIREQIRIMTIFFLSLSLGT